MSNIAHDSSDIDRSIRWITAHGVAVERWPVSGAQVPARSPASRHPLLYLVEPNADPPLATDELQDWVRLPTTEVELRARAQTLLAEAAREGIVLTSLDQDGILRVGEKLIVLSPLETTLMRLLLDDVGRVVARGEIEAALWPGNPPTDDRALNNRVKLLRRHLAPLPLRIHTVRARGLLLEVTPCSKRMAPDVYSPAGRVH